jgi:TonB family protein
VRVYVNCVPTTLDSSSLVQASDQFHRYRVCHSVRVLHLDDAGPATPRLPHRPGAAVLQVAASVLLHAIAIVLIIAAVKAASAPESSIRLAQGRDEQPAVLVRHIVFLASDPHQIGAGGGGGGNQQSGPTRRAHAIGSDAITLRTRKAPAAAVPVTTSSPAVVEDVASLGSVVLDAKPLASGTFDQTGLPAGGVSSGTSTGPGSGGGVGTGVGTGIGSGRGPGIGAGSGGGIGGGVYRPGGAVTAPRVVTEVKPTYTNDALQQEIQGSVVLEFVVTRDGRPSQIRVVRSLDPEGLDEQAVAAAAQWRFEPGRRAGSPVDVLVTVVLDFWIR